MRHIAKTLLKRPLSLNEPGVRAAVAELRRRGVHITYFLRLKNDQFYYLVKAKET